MCIFCSIAGGVTEKAADLYQAAMSAWKVEYFVPFQSFSTHLPSFTNTLGAVSATVGLTLGGVSGAPGNFGTFDLAPDVVTVGVNVKNKLDVALATGRTDVDYKTFEQDLRDRLENLATHVKVTDPSDPEIGTVKHPSPGTPFYTDQSGQPRKFVPAVLHDDLYVTTGKTFDVAQDKSFTWWTWDHTIATNNTVAGQPKRQDKDGNNVNFASSTYSSHQAFYNYVLKQANPGAFTGGSWPATRTWNQVAPSLLESFAQDSAVANNLTVVSQAYVTSTANNTALPSHQAGDLIIVAAARNNATAATIPATQTGTNINVPVWSELSYSNTQPAIANTVSMRIAYTVATGNNHTYGNWQNATGVSVVVLRDSGSRQLTVRQSLQATGASTASVAYPALTSAKQGDAILRIAARGGTSALANASNLSAAAPGYSQVSPASGNSLVSMYLLRNAPVINDALTLSQGSGASYRSATLEIGYAPSGTIPLADADLARYKFTGENANPILAAMARPCSDLDPEEPPKTLAVAGRVCGLITNTGNATNFKVTNDKDHLYIENNGSSTLQTQGLNVKDGYIYSSDKTNPNYGTTDGITGQTHPYDGNLFHMEESNNGSQMDFYGYGYYSYKDFRYLPMDKDGDALTTKNFEFAIAEDVAYDALDGVGFLFNTKVNGKPYGNGDSNSTGCALFQCMDGYLLFLEYGSSGRGSGMSIYKFSNINTYKFHHGDGKSSGGQISSTSGFTKIATAAYPSGDMSRRIKIEAGPTEVKVRYAGETARQGTPQGDAVLNTPLGSTEALTWTIQAGGALPAQAFNSTTQSVRLDTNVIKGYGFGPLGSYIGHGCSRPTHIALQNLSMTVETFKTLVDAVRAPEWHDGTLKFLVNLSDEYIEDFEDGALVGELLEHLNDPTTKAPPEAPIFYIGWANNTNAERSEAFLKDHRLQGLIINQEQSTENLACDTWSDGYIYPNTAGNEFTCVSAGTNGTKQQRYEAQMDALAETIYKYYWKDNQEWVVLTTDNVILDVNGASKTGTADATKPGKWQVNHTASASLDYLDFLATQEPELSAAYSERFVNYMQHPKGNMQWLDDLDLAFNLPGYYDIFYEERYITTIIAHKPPISTFEYEFGCGASCTSPTDNTTTITFNPRAFDSDRTPSPESEGEFTSDGRPGPHITYYRWSYINLTEGGEILPFDPADELEISDGDLYIIFLEVEDDFGSTAVSSQQIRYQIEPDASISAPYARFDVNPKTVMKNVGPNNGMIINTSYDLQGYCIAPMWSISRNGVDYPEGFSLIRPPTILTPCSSYTETPISGLSTLDPGEYEVSLTMYNQFCFAFSGTALPVPQTPFNGKPGNFASAIEQFIYTGMTDPVNAAKLLVTPPPATCKTSFVAKRTITVVEDKIPPTVLAVPAKCNGVTAECPLGHLVGSSRVNLQFSDSGGSGFASQHTAVTKLGEGVSVSLESCQATRPAPVSVQKPDLGYAQNPDDPAWLVAGWSAGSASSAKPVPLGESGALCVHTWGIDGAGNWAMDTFGPYVLVKDNTTLTLTATPDGRETLGNPTNPPSSSYCDSETTSGACVVLTATLGDLTIPRTAIGFYLDNEYLGYAWTEDGVAVFNYIPGNTPPGRALGALTPISIARHTFSAVWASGNQIYNKIDAPSVYDSHLPQNTLYDVVGPDLEVSITASSYTALVGDIVRIDFLVRNQGSSNAEGVKAVLTLPSELNVVPTFGSAPFKLGVPVPPDAIFGDGLGALDPTGIWVDGMTWDLGDLPSPTPRPSTVRKAAAAPGWQASASVYVLVTDENEHEITAKVGSSNRELELENNARLLTIGPLEGAGDESDGSYVGVAERGPKCRALDYLISGGEPAEEG